MQFPNEHELKALRERYPAGTKIRLFHMGADPDPVPLLTVGEVTFVDDAGGIHMKWKNGRGLALYESEDDFKVISDSEYETYK